MYEVWTDGSVRGNPGLGGIGVVVKKSGHLITILEKRIGEKVTSNEAEYVAVMEGIKLVASLNNPPVEECVIYTDSQLVHGQLVKGWRINFDHLFDLNHGIKNLVEIADFKISFKLIGREKNVEANDVAQACTKKYKKEMARNGV